MNALSICDFIIKNLNFLHKKAEKLVIFKKNSIRNLAKRALIPKPLDPWVFSPLLLITRNRCEIIFRAILKMERRLSPHVQTG